MSKENFSLNLIHKDKNCEYIENSGLDPNIRDFWVCSDQNKNKIDNCDKKCCQTSITEMKHNTEIISELRLKYGKNMEAILEYDSNNQTYYNKNQN